MKKAILTILILFSILNIYAQLNPVSNLQFQHRYECPMNYFILTWSCDTTAADSLVGFNIYRDDQFYEFTTKYHFYNDPFYGEEPNASGSFLYFNMGDDFYIHVTAVYTKDSLESAYTDSIHCLGAALSSLEFENSDINIFPNPAGDYVKVRLSAGLEGTAGLRVYNVLGKEILQMPLTQMETAVDLSHFPKGIYVFRISSGEDVKSIKVLKQ